MTTTLPPRDAAEQARLDATLIELIERGISFNEVLGMKVQQLRPQFLVRFDMRPALVGTRQHGRLHGGVIASVLDAVGGCALVLASSVKHAHESTEQMLHRFDRLGTIDLRIDFLRPGLGKHFIATTEVTRLGGRVGSTQMRLVNDEGTLIATGAGAYVVS